MVAVDNGAKPFDRGKNMGVSFRVRNGIIHLIYSIGGRKYEETTGLHVCPNPIQNKEVMALAEILRSRKELEIVRGINGIELQESKMSLYEYVAKCSRNSKTRMEKVLPYLDRFDGRRIKISAVTARWFENFQNRMKFDSGLKSAHTQERYSCIVRQCLKKAVRDGLLQRDPASGIKHISVPDSKKEFLSAQEVRQMALTEYRTTGVMSVQLQDEIRRAFLFGCLTGFRISDIRQLTWDCIDAERMEICKRQQKTKRLVIVPIKESILTLLGERPDDPAIPLFPELARTETTTNRYIHKWAAKAGIRKNVTWHTARHTDATLLLESGSDLYTVMRLLGHTKIQTTMQYAVVSDKKKREAVQNLPDVL